MDNGLDPTVSACARSPRRRSVLLVAAAALAVSGAAALAVVATADGGGSTDAPILRGVLSAPRTTVPPATPTTLALPQPQDSPADPYAAVPIRQIGSIEIPRIELSAPIYDGIWLTVLDVGPGHWPGTASPGGYGNTVVAGHRVTHGKPFRRIDELRPGDPIVLSDSTGRYTYVVTGDDVVTPDRVDIVTQRPGYTLTLFACHPPGSAQYRYVVYGRLVSASRPPGA